MKERLKKVFTNKEFWTALIGCLGLLLSIALSYFSGFKDGILIDNTIRTELIEKAVDDAKNNSKSNLVKKAINVSDIPIYDADINITQRGSFNIGVIKSTSSARFVMLDYTISIGQPDGATSQVYYSIDIDVDLSDTFNNSTYTDLNNVRDSYTSIFYTSFYGTHDISLEYLKHFQCDFIPSVFKNTDTYGNENLYFHLDMQLDFTAVNNTITYEELRSDDYVVSGFNTLNLAFISTNDYYVIFNDVNSQLVFYYNGYINGYDNGEINGKEIGFNEGYQARQDSVEDTEQKVNSIWSILEKGITSALNVLSFEILPGIPLYICVAVPILLGLILWVVKMGGS